MAKEIYSVKEWEEHFRNYKWSENEVFESMTGMGDNKDKLPTYRELENVRVDTYCKVFDQEEYYLTYKPFSRIPKTISTWHEYGRSDDEQEITIQLEASLHNKYNNTVEYKINNIYTKDDMGNRIQWVDEYETQNGVPCTSNRYPLKTNDIIHINLDDMDIYGYYYIYTNQNANVLHESGYSWVLELHDIETNRIPSVYENNEVDFLYRVNEIV